MVKKIIKKDVHTAEIIELKTNPKKILTKNDEMSYIVTDEIQQSLRIDGLHLVLAIKEIAKSLNSRKEHHCPNCGGLLPELGIVLGNRLYKFTCYEVESTKTNKVLRETDYKKLGEYINRLKSK